MAHHCGSHGVRGRISDECVGAEEELVGHGAHRKPETEAVFGPIWIPCGVQR